MNKMFTNKNKKRKDSDMSNFTLNPNNDITSQVQVYSENQVDSEIQKLSEIDTESDLPNVGGDLDAFLPINKVPLTTDMGGYSRAHSVRLEKDGKEVEMGVVGENYLLVPNKQLMEVAQGIIDISGLSFKPIKKFFNGKQFRYVWQIEDAGLEVKVPEVGDVMGICMMMNNSYDGSLKAGIQLFLMRLACLNGQTSREYGWGIDFRHYNTNGIDWEQNIIKAGSILKGKQIEALPTRFANDMSNLLSPITLQDLSNIRQNDEYLGKLPAQQYAQMMDKMFDDGMVTDSNSFTAYDLFNAGTNVLWHQKKMTTASFKNNALVVDGMMNYGKSLNHGIIPDPNQYELELPTS